MTVGELLEALKDEDPDMEVRVNFEDEIVEVNFCSNEDDSDQYMNLEVR